MSLDFRRPAAFALVLALACAVLSPPIAVASAAVAKSTAAVTDAGGLRKVAPLATGWRFHLGDVEGSATTAAFDDSNWESVSVPHTWNRVGEYSVKRSASSNNVQGVGWYRLKFPVPRFKRDERVYLDFAAVGNIAQVWVNGVRVGEHRGAFSRFRFDVTSLVHPGAEALVAVRADNSKPAPGSSTSEILPLAGDFFIHGGLYRPVALLVAPAAGIDLLDFAGPGVYATAKLAAPDRANVSVMTRLRNTTAKARRLEAVATVHAADGKAVASSSAFVTLPKAGTAKLEQWVSVANPHRWNGRQDPYLYTVSVELRDGRKVVDCVTQPLGIREFRVDPAQGFFLNGKHLALFGASRHQDRAGKGWALAAEDHVEDMSIMAEMGLNTVRMAHYQHDDRWADEADRQGMVAWAEVPYVSASAFDGTAGTPATFANAEQQTRELVRQNFNHPSIFMWSVGNEVDASAIFLNNGKPPRSLKLLQFINGIAKEEDASRPTVFADCCEESMFSMLNQEVLAGTADLIGYNRYYGWYYGKPAELGPALDHFHAKHPQLPISVSEFGAGGALTQHSDNPLGGPVSAFGRPHPEEYQAWYHEESFEQLASRPYVFASWVWNMFDFASDLREEGEAIDLNDKGLVTFDRKTRKDAYYFYQARLAGTPVLHLTGKRYRDRAYPVMDVKAYSNAGEATLSLNGVSVGTVACALGRCVWPAVQLRQGVNRAEVRARFGTEQKVDVAEWVGPDASLGLRVDAGDLSGHAAADGERFGSDQFFKGGEVHVLNTAVFKGATRPPRREVAGARDAMVFENYREGAFSYGLPLPNGKWRVLVHTFEPPAAAANAGATTRRTFGIRVNGTLRPDAVDPMALAGGAQRAAVVEIPVEVMNGMLQLDFVPGTGPALVAALEVVK